MNWVVSKIHLRVATQPLGDVNNEEYLADFMIPEDLYNMLQISHTYMNALEVIG